MLRSQLSMPALALAAGLVVGTSPPALAQSLPERPAIQREVTGIIDVGGPLENDHDARFQRPHVPAYRTTQDGRLGMSVDFNPRFTLIVPEKLTRPVLLEDAGAHVMSWTESAYLGGDPARQAYLLTAGTGRTIQHTCLWDDGLPTTNRAAQDVYRIKVLVTTTSAGDPGSAQLFVTPLRVTVDRPKSRFASIAEIAVDGPTVAGPDFKYNGPASFSGTAFEPTIAGDGRLLVFRVRSQDLPTPGGDVAADIVYSYYEDPNGALGTANPLGWTTVYPIAHAYHDPRLNRPLESGGFGFAQFPLTDAAGTALGPWEDLGATYPWIDREAKNLFFTTIGDTLHYQDPNPQFPNRDPQSAAEWMNTRYEATGVPGDPRERWGQESFEHFQGAAFAGLWSHGRIVLLDGLLNDMDYAVGSSRASTYGQLPYNVGPQQRLVRLFEGSPVPSTDPASGWLRLGYGRANESPALPVGENTNTTILDSLQNKLAYRRRAQPLALRDVVWHVSNGKHTDEVVFDDHVDPDALIVADMTGLVTLPDTSGTGFNDLVHHSGWDELSRAFAAPVRVQNGATYTARWTVSPFGELVGQGAARGRLEPAALGGVQGKGLWLANGVGLEFEAPRPAHGAVPTPAAFYAGVFLDCRFDDDGFRRPLLRFPDGSGLELLGRRQVLFTRGTEVLHRATLPAPFMYVPEGGGAPMLHEFLPRGGWAHLGLRIERAGRQVTLLLDGLAFSRWEHASEALFQPLATSGVVQLGGPTGASLGSTAPFRGWVDGLRLFAHDVDPESAANHAGGTLVGFTPAMSGTALHEGLAASYPDWVHAGLTEALRRRGEPGHARYAVVRDLSRDRGTHAGTLPAATVHLREAFHFPEGPLFHDRPRPDSTSNAFCTTCHHADGIGGLSLAALEHRPTIALRDSRRQPSQPPALIGGVVPNRLVDAGPTPGPRNGEARSLDGRPVAVDQWMLERFGARVAEVGGVTLVDAATGTDLGGLVAGASLDPARLGASLVDVRVDLDVAQGAVELLLRELSPSGPVVRAARNAGHAPYHLFGAGAGLDLLPGSYELQVTPEGGAAILVPFTVVPRTPRVVASVRDAFRAGSPAEGWIFARTAADPSDPTRFATLAWEPVAGVYDELGLAAAPPGEFGAGHIGPNGGRPGPGTSQAGGGVERGAAVGYRVRTAGFYLVRQLGQSNTAGGEVTIRALHQAQLGGAAVLLHERVLPGAASVSTLPRYMEAGDLLWVVVTPGATDLGDEFDWDYVVQFNETGWLAFTD